MQRGKFPSLKKVTGIRSLAALPFGGPLSTHWFSCFQKYGDSSIHSVAVFYKPGKIVTLMDHLVQEKNSGILIRKRDGLFLLPAQHCQCDKMEF